MKCVCFKISTIRKTNPKQAYSMTDDLYKTVNEPFHSDAGAGNCL